MEDRRPLYYDRNSVAVPKPGASRQNRLRQVGLGRQYTPDKIPQNRDPKVCATLQCVWCGHPFDDYMIVCPRCSNCQYCGLNTDNFYFCHFCNNKAPAELLPPEGEKTIRIG